MRTESASVSSIKEEIVDHSYESLSIEKLESRLEEENERAKSMMYLF